MSDTNETILQRATAELSSLQSTLTGLSSWASASLPDVPPVIKQVCKEIKETLDTLSSLTRDDALLREREMTVSQHETTIRRLDNVISAREHTIMDQEDTIDVQATMITSLEARIAALQVELDSALDSTNLAEGSRQTASIDATTPGDEGEITELGEGEPRPKRQRVVRDLDVTPSSTMTANPSSTQPQPQRQSWAKALQEMGNFVGPWTQSQIDIHLLKLERCCAKKPAVEVVIEDIDRHAFGVLTSTPPHPRPCLFASLLRHTKGPGGDDHTYENCPTCKGDPDQVCCWAEMNPNVAQPFHARDTDGIVPREGRAYDLKDPRTAASPHGASSRWFWHIRKSASTT